MELSEQIWKKFHELQYEINNECNRKWVAQKCLGNCRDCKLTIITKLLYQIQRIEESK